jgi:DNA adenine methylase
MPYAGGKQRLAKTIIAMLPTHRHYVEPYAGALSVLLAKPVSHIETVNDLDGEIVAFWRVLRDRPDALERLCALTPHAREEYVACRDHGLDVADDELAKAWRVWVKLTQSRGARADGSSGWRFLQGATTRKSLAAYLDGYVARVAPAAERLKRVSIECRPALEVIRSYDRADAFFYVDPPYLPSVRQPAMYHHEMTASDHEDLLDVLLSVEGKVVLSGYRSALYDDRLAQWARTDLTTTSMTGSTRVESLWANYQLG